MGWAQLEGVWGYIVPLPADGSGGTAAGFVLCTWKSRINPPQSLPLTLHLPGACRAAQQLTQKQDKDHTLCQLKLRNLHFP